MSIGPLLLLRRSDGQVTLPDGAMRTGARSSQTGLTRRRVDCTGTMADPSATLPEILELKRTLDGQEKRFACRLIEGDRRQAVVLFIAPAAMHVHGIDLPAGTVTFGYFWTDRLYNVYHWLGERGQTIAFYFNLADRTVIADGRLEWRDLTLDVLATPAGRLDVLDEDELPRGPGRSDARAHRGSEAIDPGRSAAA